MRTVGRVVLTFAGLIGLLALGFVLPGASLGQPTSGGTLVVAVLEEADRLDPQLAAQSSNVPLLFNIYDTLMRYDLNLQLHPHLAASYQQLNSTTYRFKLRGGVRFHNGRQMTAEDVRFSLLRAKGPKVVRRFVENISDVRVVDRSTVEIKLSSPDPLALHWLAQLQTAVVPREEIEKAGEDAFGSKPVGTGPFKLVEWNRGSRLILEANKDYFLGRPLLDRVVFRTIPDPVTMLLELETGKIDITREVFEDEYARARANKDLVVVGILTPDVRMLGFNAGGKRNGAKRDSPFNDPRARLAVFHAVRWDEVFRSVTPFPAYGKRNFCYGADKTDLYSSGCKDLWPKPNYDPERAKQLLSLAGYPKDFRPTILVWQKSHEKQAIVIQNDLKKVGINAEVRFLELATWNDAVVSGDADMFILRWGAGTPDPFGWIYKMFNSSQFGLRGNVYWYSNPRADQLLNQAQASTGKERIDIFRQAQALIIRDAPAIPISTTGLVMAWNKKVKGFRPDPVRDWEGGVYRLWVPYAGIKVSVGK